MTRRRVGSIGLAVAVGLVLALLIDVARLGGPMAWLAKHGLGPPYDARGGMVEVAPGREVYLDCRGPVAGAGPTVILENGYGSGAAGWGLVLDEIARFARVCAWDRPGIGRSSARGLHDAAATIDDLRTALAAAGGAPPPYVVVGHSLGGVYARVFAALHPTEVAGLVMVDAYYPDLAVEDRVDVDEAYRAGARATVVETGGLVQAGEELDWAATMALLERADGLPQPTEILAVDQRLRYVDVDEPTRVALVAAWEEVLHERFLDARITIVRDSDHLIQLRRPDLVVEATRRVLEAAGSGGSGGSGGG